MGPSDECDTLAGQLRTKFGKVFDVMEGCGPHCVCPSVRLDCLGDVYIGAPKHGQQDLVRNLNYFFMQCVQRFMAWVRLIGAG
jgi:hypothetical protein